MPTNVFGELAETLADWMGQCERSCSGVLPVHA